MGYHTDFSGQFSLSTPLTHSQNKYLTIFSNTRRMKRNPDKIYTLESPNMECLGLLKELNLPLGIEGEFYGGNGFMGQDNDESVINHNMPPSTQPGLWCQWIPNEDGTAIVWDEGEKFYEYVEWIKYLIKNFFIPWNIKLNGTVTWQGEEPTDAGEIKIIDNNVEIYTYERKLRRVK